MKAFSNYNETQVFTDTQKIPAGGYLAVIKAAEVKIYNGRNGDFEKLEISFDITDGEYKDYYATQYRNNQAADKKWKGKVSIYVPTDDGSEQDAITKRRFKTAIEAIEDSNKNYHWDWDEGKLKGKKCGVVLQNKEWSFNDKTGWSAVPYSICSTDAIKDGTFYMPADKPLNGHQTANATPAPASSAMTTADIIEDDDLPF